MTVAYLGTPYTLFPRGIEAAFIEASKLAARLIQSGVNVYAPISHTHPIAVHGGIDPLDQQLWYDFDKAMMSKCDVLIVAHMDGWEQSTGIAHEVAFFAEQGRPIFDLDPGTLRMEKRS